MGDFTKGISLGNMPERIALGIKNHLEVDKYTDSHVIVKGTKKLFSKERRRFSGIITDVLFDHFLIKHWSSFSNEKLNTFINYSYQCLSGNMHLMPERMQKVTTLMIKHNGLMLYTTLSGIDEALNRTSARIRFSNNLAGAIEEVTSNYSTLEQGFLEFFPRLHGHVLRTAIEGKRAYTKSHSKR